jgi:sulfoxide reductase heme-binding subunit YedZ
MERGIKVGVFLICLLPFLWVLYASVFGNLGPDPAKVLMLFTGEWALRMLALTLLVSPLRAWTGNALWLRLRRMLGLFTYFYACVHFLTFLQLYTGWDAVTLSKELAERPYIALGFFAWTLMLPLAITSTRGMQRRLRTNWRRLHTLVYPAAVLACLHLLWQARSDIGEALLYILVFAALLAWRVRRRLLNQHSTAAVKA